jgi:hypothetical protein
MPSGSLKQYAITFLLFGGFFLVFVNSSSSKKRRREEFIVYRSFPALEARICQRIAQRFNGKSDSLFIMLESAQSDGSYSYTRFFVTLQHFRDYPDAGRIARKSNRVMKVCGANIPIYFEYADRIFTEIPNAATRENGLIINIAVGPEIIGTVDMLKDTLE